MKCFTCSECGTYNCPNIQYEMAGDYADDIGMERISCKECHHNTGKCEDCLANYYPELCRKEKENGH